MFNFKKVKELKEQIESLEKENEEMRRYIKYFQTSTDFEIEKLKSERDKLGADLLHSLLPKDERSVATDDKSGNKS